MVLLKLYVYFVFVFVCFFNDLYNSNENLYRYIYSWSNKIIYTRCSDFLELNIMKDWTRDIQTFFFFIHVTTFICSANSAKFAIQTLKIMYAGDQPQSRYPTVIAPYNSTVTAGTGVWWAQMPLPTLNWLQVAPTPRRWVKNHKTYSDPFTTI